MRTLLPILFLVAACSRKAGTTDDKTPAPPPPPVQAPAAAPTPADVNQKIVDELPPLEHMKPPADAEPVHDGQWVELKVDGKRNLAFVYTDHQAGPSAKGGPVSDPPTKSEINELVERPSSTWREPSTFGAHPLDAATVAKLKLPAEPSWMSYYK